MEAERDATATGSDLGFPLRVAAIDTGSNAIRFTAAEFRDRSRRVELAYRRVPVRLGQSAFLTGRLTEEKVEAAVEAMVSFRQQLDRLEVQAHRAVATSAVRESRNGEELIERVRRESGIRIETITGGEEARLVWLAARERFPLEGRWMLVDLGGGSLEVSVVADETGIEWSESHPIGTVRLLDELGGPDAPAAELDRLLDECFEKLRLPRPGDEALRGLVATGGNIEELAELAGAATGDGPSRLSLEELESTTDRLGAMTNDERIEDLGLREDRADVIVPAGRIYHRVAELVGAEELVVPNVGVAEGVLLDLVDGPSRSHGSSAH